MQILAFLTLIDLKIPPTTNDLLINIRNIVTFDISLVGKLFERNYFEYFLDEFFMDDLKKDIKLSP